MIVNSLFSDMERPAVQRRVRVTAEKTSHPCSTTTQPKTTYSSTEQQDLSAGMPFTSSLVTSSHSAFRPVAHTLNRSSSSKQVQVEANYVYQSPAALHYAFWYIPS